MAVVVPAHRASPEFRRCLVALAACDPPPDELIVVVDGADEATVTSAQTLAGQVIAPPESGGPARARNLGAAASHAEVLFFVDSDVAVRADVIGRLQARFASRPDLDALIGSYDDDPPAPGRVSQYKNLLNHHTHQRAAPSATTFWGACGAIRRSVFERVGGFDAQRYDRPCVEDIELGYRLVAAGHRIEVVKDLQVTHLKRWTLAGMVRADVLDRAVPWSELIVTGAGFTDDLNISRVQRAKTAVAGLGLLAGLLGVRVRRARLPAVAALGVLTLADLPLLRFLARRRGARFAATVAPLHWGTYVYSAATFAGVAIRHRLGRAPNGRTG